MILSAYRLISGERSLSGGQEEVRDGHNVTLGQEFRGEIVRFLVSAEEIGVFESLTPNKLYTTKIRGCRLQKKYTARVEYIEEGDEKIWSSGIPSIGNSWVEDGLIIHAPEGGFDKGQQAADIVAGFLKLEDGELFNRLLEQDKNFNLIFGSDKEWTLVWIYKKKDERKKITYRTMLVPSMTNRLPEKFEKLNGKKVGIVGCGSVGSKIAASLARSGVETFLLVDDDIFFAGNLVRNELDMESIGFQKVDALKERILRINPQSKVEVRRVVFGGQESSASVTSVFEDLGQCQLIIDATADDRAFSLNAAVAKRFCIPLVWCSVLAGGVGGMVARSMPNRDPIPRLAKAQINAWYESQGVSWEGVEQEADYATQIGSETPMIASDADVSVIASHAARFSLDALIYEGETSFPYPAYIIGLSDKWIFRAPFDTFPIEFRAEGEWGEESEENNPEELKKLLSDLFPSDNHDR